MQVTDSGYFRITNDTTASSPIFAQLDNQGNWSAASDRRVKHDIESASDLLEKALKLNPVSFFYNGQDLAAMPHKLLGFIADEVQALFPHLVTEGETKYLNYDGLIPVAIGALQELKRAFDERVASLEAQLAQLRSSAG
jgi:hypothetical protein